MTKQLTPSQDARSNNRKLTVHRNISLLNSNSCDNHVSFIFRQTILYFLSILELILAFICTLLTFPPIGILTFNVCQVKLLSDFYPMFHNPIVNYQKKLRCSYEVVYPLYV
jgi:hypothetical protein